MEWEEVGESQNEVNPETGRAKIQRDISSNLEYLTNLATQPAGLSKLLAVPTGPMWEDRLTKSGKPSSTNGRGKSEYATAQDFRAAAKVMDRSVDVKFIEHRSDGKTVLKITLQPKRVTTPEIEHKRQVALAQWRVNDDKTRIAAFEATLANAGASAEDKAKATEELTVKREGLTRHEATLVALQKQAPAANGAKPAAKPAAKASA